MTLLREDVAKGDVISQQWGSFRWRIQTHVYTFTAIPSETPSDAKFPWNKAEVLYYSPNVDKWLITYPPTIGGG